MNFSNFGKNALFYAVGTIGLRTAALALVPVYTYSLTITDYGLLAVLLQTAQIMVTVMSLGSRTALVRFAKEYEDKNQLDVLMGTSVFINLLGAAVVTAAAILFSPFFKSVLHTDHVLLYLLLTCTASAFNCLSVHLVAYYRAGQDGFKVTVANLSGAVCLILLTIVLLRVFHLGVYGALLSQTIIYGLLAAFLFVTICSRTGVRVSLPLARDLIRFGLPLILVMTGGLITQGSALYFLSYFRGLAEVSLYSLGSKMAQVAEMVLILPFVMAYEPFVYSQSGDSRVFEAISRLLTYLMIAFAFVACGIVFVARDLMGLVAPPIYGSAYLVVFLILPPIAFRGVYYIGESLLFLKNKTRLAGSVVTTVTAIGVALNYGLIRYWGMYGAIAVFAFTTVLTGAVVLKLGLGMSLVQIETERLGMAAVLLVVLLAAVYGLHDANKYLYYGGIPIFACAGALLLYASSFIKEDERRVIQQLLGRANRFRSVFGV